jgi:hypothetical protein
MSEALLLLKPLHLNREGTCSDFDVREGNPSGRTVGRVYQKPARVQARRLTSWHRQKRIGALWLMICLHGR